MAKKADKTNVMRILDQKGIAYIHHTYGNEPLSAMEVAEILGQDASRLFKTLVTVGKSGENYVFMAPGECELDLKKAARATGEKALGMLPQKALLPLTGYVHGGCSPIGMKKQFRTFIDSSAEQFETIFFSGGRVGDQVELKPDDLMAAFDVTPADIVKDR